MLQDLATHSCPFVPGFLVRYLLPTNEFIRRVGAPSVLFQGDWDAVIYYGSFLKLKALLKPADKLVVLPGAGHNGLTDELDEQCDHNFHLLSAHFRQDLGRVGNFWNPSFYLRPAGSSEAPVPTA